MAPGPVPKRLFPSARGNFFKSASFPQSPKLHGLMEATMHGIIYLVGLIVVVLAILSFFGLR